MEKHRRPEKEAQYPAAFKKNRGFKLGKGVGRKASHNFYQKEREYEKLTWGLKHPVTVESEKTDHYR